MKRLTLLAAGLLTTCVLGAQNVRDLVISEVMPEPDSTSLVDDYGRRTGWIELYNTSTGTVSYGGCFLTDDRDNLRKSLIPAWDRSTKLGPRQTVVFYASGCGSDGTFYAGFTLRPGATVYLVSNDGRTVVDSLPVPAALPQGKSVVKKAVDLREKVYEVMPEAADPSPRMVNKDPDAETKGQIMAHKDPHGLILALVSISVVFAALALLWFLFANLFSPKKPRIPRLRPSKAPDEEVAAAVALALDMEQGGEVYAAIALALHLYLNDSVHDAETYVLTYGPVSPQWNNKELNFRKLPR